ncbi:MAG: hypothetical protein M3332_12055, partial [Actinomycetota bacterium]|nr:hypothetical protein [Actinomycetota bacterium]
MYQVIDSTKDAVGAFQSVYGKSLHTFTYEEQAEALLILSGIDSCGQVSAIEPVTLALLLSGRPNSGTDTVQTALAISQATPTKQAADSTEPRAPETTEPPPPETT